MPQTVLGASRNKWLQFLRESSDRYKAEQAANQNNSTTAPPQPGRMVSKRTAPSAGDAGGTQGTGPQATDSERVARRLGRHAEPVAESKVKRGRRAKGDERQRTTCAHSLAADSMAEAAKPKAQHGCQGGVGISRALFADY